MADQQAVLDEAKRKLEEILEPIRTKVNLVFWAGLAAMSAFCVLFAFVARFRFPLAFFPVIVLLIGIFRFKSELRKTFWQDYYEDELKYLEKEPESGDDYYARGHTLDDLEFYEAAVEDYRKAVEMDPDDIYFLYSIISTLWVELKNGEEALPYIERLMKIEGDYQADAFMFHGQILAETDPETALQSFDEAVRLDPDDSDYALAKLRFLIESDRLDKAADFMGQVAETVKREGGYEQDTLLGLQALSALKLGDAEEAVRLVSKALKLAPADEDLYRLRSEAYDVLGKYDKADADRRKAEKLDEE